MDNDVLPDFFIIGAAKSGTTSLFNSLVKHPQVYLPRGKGTHFFSNDERYEAGIQWYLRHFEETGNYVVRGEQDVHYLYWSEKVAARLKELYGDQRLKFIAIFRDPVSRALSFYWQAVRVGAEDVPFTVAVEKEEERLRTNWENLRHSGEMWYGYYRGGCYATLLQPYLTLFPDSQFMFLLQEDLRRDFSGALSQACKFLGVDHTISFKPVVSNPAALPRFKQLEAWIRHPSGVKNMLKAALPASARDKTKKIIRKMNRQPLQYEPMDLNLEHELRLRYVDEIQRLERIINRDLSHWLSPVTATAQER